MTEFQPSDPDFENRVRKSFDQQTIMELLGAEMQRVAPGYCEIFLPFNAKLCQQDGFFHAGVTGTIADSAGGYAGYTLMDADTRVLTVEYKMNLLAPADGESLLARGSVIKNGRSLIISQVDVDVQKNGSISQCATLLQTLMCLRPRGNR